MKPVDPRLLRYARATRHFLAASVALGLVGAGLVIAQAMLIAEIVVGAFQQGAAPADLRTPLLLLAAVSLGRALVSWLTELAAHRAGAAVKSELRMRLLTHVGSLGPAWLAGRRTGELTTLATRGIDALDDYFARYLPQLGLAVVVPVAVLARVVTADWLSALIIAVTLPLIPLFMVLIGWATQSRMDRQWRLLSRLSGHFLDVVAGLPTLKVFGRAKAQAESIRSITADYRRATLRTLRIAFLSSFALELLATLSVALVAVGIGMRLVHGELDLYTGLVILILAPEAYFPIRQVGAHYHAAAEGLSAADEVFRVLEVTPHSAGRTPAPDARTATLTVDRLVVRHPGRTEPSLPETTLTIRPGETVALVGPSGAGKSTLLSALIGFARPASGRVLVGGTDLATIDPDSWRAQLAWVPQHPHLFAGTVADNVRLARPDADGAAVLAALRDAGAGDLAPDRVLGEGGSGLSAGQRQRVALARAILADRPVLLLDEPTAALDGETEAAIVDTVRRLAVGRTVLLVVHRPALLAVADWVLHLPGNALGGVLEGVGVPGRVSLGKGISAAGHEAAAGEGGRLAEGAGEAAEPGLPAPPAVLPTDDQRSALSIRPTAGQHPAGDACQTGSQPSTEIPRPTKGQRSEILRPTPGQRPAALHQRQTGSQPSAATLPTTAGQLSAMESQSGGRTPARGAGVGPLARIRAMAGPLRGRFVLATVLGALALGSAVGLMAASGWLISRASEQPPVLYLMVAVTATRAFGIGRAVFRYAERLVSHDAVLRVLADLRVSVYRRLERLAPVGLRDTRRGDLLSRLVADVDALQDYFLRWLLPAAVAVTVGLASAGLTAWLLPEAGAALALGLIAAGVAVPALTAAVSRRTERRLAPARGALATRTVDLLTGTGELSVAGALPRRTDDVRGADRVLTELAARSSAVTALGGGLTALASGLTVATAAWLGVQAVYDGRLPGVCLAVVVLTPLAAFEAVTGLGQAVQHRQRVRRSAERVYEVLEAPLPVREPEEGEGGEEGAVGTNPTPASGASRPTAAGTHAAGTEAARTQAAGTEAARTHAAGTEAAGTEATGTHAAGTEAARTEAARTEAARTEAARTEAARTEVARTEAARTEALGSASAPSAKAPDTAPGALAADATAASTTARGAAPSDAAPMASQPASEPRPSPVPRPSTFPLALRGITARYPGHPGRQHPHGPASGPGRPGHRGGPGHGVPGIERPALTEFDLDLSPGRRIAVVGPSGSGKTTVAQVLLRFLEPQCGSYTLGGRDATSLPGDTVRRSVGLCAQDAHVFDSSLRENLRLARPSATEADLRAALASARLLDWVDTLPEGLDTMVGEHGARLSGGQRQRLALARALLADFPVLVLDEPAEHLDLPTADALTADLLSATEGRTTVLITHRLAALEGGAVDEVIVLDEGHTVQRGSYAELASVDGPFRRMLEREERTAEGELTAALTAGAR